jgi:hypothetical protein
MRAREDAWQRVGKQADLATISDRPLRTTHAIVRQTLEENVEK